MTNITDDQIKIEEIRRRAKDNKANIGSFFVQLSESYLDKTRNYAFLISLAIIGYIGTLGSSSFWNVTISGITLISGLVSTFFSYMYSINNAKYYSTLESNLSRLSFPTSEEYNKMISKETTIKDEYEYRHIFQNLAIVFLIAQAVTTTL